MTLKTSNFFINSEPKRDSYGFTVRPQHLQRFREYASIYKEEEGERLQKWKAFLEQYIESGQPPSSEENTEIAHSEVTEEKATPGPEVSRESDDSSEQKSISVLEQYIESGQSPSSEENKEIAHSEVTEEKATTGPEVSREGDDSNGQKSISDVQAEDSSEKEVHVAVQKKIRKVQTWAQIRPSLNTIDYMMSFRIKKRKNMNNEQMDNTQNHLPSIKEVRSSREECEEQAYDNEMVDDCENASGDGAVSGDGVSPEPFFHWKEELEFLVHGGVPRELRGEVWQAFVGVRTRRIRRYYQDLLTPESDGADSQSDDKSLPVNSSNGCNNNSINVPEKWRKQIEKDLPRTFPGHPALNDNGRNSLRRVLLAYARHNPSVGYCQAMNFFAGLLLLMMPEENAFWTLVGIIDDYFDGYFSQEMIESQVDQLVFEELMHERFPKLVNHLEYLGVQVAWISGPWFLSIFVNMLPWESVLRVWDVLLFEGNRVMLFRTALSLMELYGPAIVTTKDAGDAIILLQSLAGSTFDSSQLVLTACMGYLNVTEERLQELRQKHRPSVLEAIEERSKGGRVWKDSKGLATKLYSFKKDAGSLIKETNPEVSGSELRDGDPFQSESHSTKFDELLDGIAINSEGDSLQDLQEQVVWLKVELCRLLEEKRASTIRAEELETSLMEMAQQDNRRQLSARVEYLEQQVAKLKQALTDKNEQENAMLQVLLRVEQEQRLTEDARIAAEQDAAAKKYAVHILQEKYDNAMASLAQMEKRVVMAESMLEATLQYKSGQNKALSSPGSGHADSSPDIPMRKPGLLSFGLGWRDRNKGKPPAPSSEIKPTDEGLDTSIRY